MMLVQIFKIIALSTLIKFVLCEFTEFEQSSSENSDEENAVLDSVFDTINKNYEIKLRENLNKLNLISVIRRERSLNKPLKITTESADTVASYVNHQSEVYQKNPASFPLGHKRIETDRIRVGSLIPDEARSDRAHDEYHIIANREDEKKDHHPDLSMLLLFGKKYLFGGFAIIALLAILFKALIIPLKFWLFLKAFAIANTFLAWVVLFRFLKISHFHGIFGLKKRINSENQFDVPGKSENKLQTIKDILNSEDAGEEDIDYKSDDDEDVLSKENVDSSQIFHNPFNSTEVAEEFVQNLVKLMKQKNKNW